jgi:hypothetical protein
MKPTFRTVVACASLGLLLAACGGGNGDDNDATDNAAVPAAALESPQVFSRWVGERKPQDTSDPLNMMNVLPPASDSDEPIDFE